MSHRFTPDQYRQGVDLIRQQFVAMNVDQLTGALLLLPLLRQSVVDLETSLGRGDRHSKNLVRLRDYLSHLLHHSPHNHSITIPDPTRWLVPTETGRIPSTDPKLQNVPIKPVFESQPPLTISLEEK